MGLTGEFIERGSSIRGLCRAPSQFGTHPPALRLGRREIAHVHRGEVEVRLTRAGIRARRPELEADIRIDLRRPGSDWVRLRLRRRDDAERALELLRDAVRIERAASA